MNIVVIDGFTLNPGDLSWAGFEVLGRCTIYPRTAPEQVIERCVGADVVLTNKVVFSDEVLAQLPRLKYLGVLATGYNVVDVAAAERRGIAVTNIPAYGAQSVAQFVFAQILQWAQPVHYYAETVKAKRWQQSADFCYYDHSMIELAGKTLGIIGFGAIGKKVAQIALGFDMQVLIHTRTPPASLPEGMDCVDLTDLAKNSDIISLHCPLTSANERFINAAFLNAMKVSAYLINTGRGPLIDETALFDAIDQKRIAGAALDVLSVEPPQADHTLFKLPGCVVTPHIAWATLEARQRLMGIAVDNLSAYLLKHRKNRLDGTQE
ncbi:MAG: D-2-hydroxyacid dehydrogenase [Cellvibrionaceae bacterium]